MEGMSTSPDRTHELATLLRAYLSTQRGAQVEVSPLTSLSNGWESDVYAFDTMHRLEADSSGADTRGDDDRRADDRGADTAAGGYILRLFFGNEAAQKARHEGNAYALLARAGYPVPRVALVEPSTAALGRAFLVLERIQGVSLGRRWHGADGTQQARELARFCELFAALHTLAWQHLPGAAQVPSFTAAEQIAYWQTLINARAVTGLDTGLAWLQRNIAHVTPQPLGLAHWDFHHENILVDEQDRLWVIDWTQFQATDARFDLAWTLVLLASERDAASAQLVRKGYFAVRGWREEEVAEELAWFEAAACFKRLVSVVVSLLHGADALGMRPGAEAIMTSRMARIALVYQQWLALTATPISAADEMLAGYL